jgi:sugar transferase EpsL
MSENRQVERAAKRLLDLLGATLGSIIALPFAGLIWVVVRVRMGSPAFYGQVRAGRDGAPFTLWKFRTMTGSRDESGSLLPDAQRLRALGLLLRRFSLDELPQLVNVLCGEMSLVGPRPLLLRYLPRYSPRQRLRLVAKPGITGWAQVNGRNTTDWSTRLELDAWYAENWTFGLDLKILALTLLQVFKTGSVKPGAGAELDEFWGEAGPPAEGPRAFPVEQDERAAVVIGQLKERA